MAFLSCQLCRTFRFGWAGLNNATVSWSGWTFVRASCIQPPVVGHKPLVLKASKFQHLFEEGPTEKVYANSPVSGLGQTQQGKAVEEWARKVLQELNPETQICDPDLGMCRNGSRRGTNTAEYDFLMGGRRVEIKSSRMAWTSTERAWHVEFCNIKLPFKERTTAAFDDLYVVILSPRGLHLIKHDLVAGVGRRGLKTAVSGHAIKVRGSRGTDCWGDALDEILEKLCEGGGCSVVSEQPFSELGLNAFATQVSPGTAAVAGLPMSSMSREKRGNRIQEIGVTIDRRLHPHSKFHFQLGNSGKSNGPVDWVRGTARVELKSCVLTLNHSSNRWQCRFQWIKPDLFDELWLAIYSVVGIHFYRSKSCKSLAFAKTGALTKTHRHQLRFCAPRGELNPLEAFKTIEVKMISTGCELVAVMDWEKGSSAPHRHRFFGRV